MRPLGKTVYTKFYEVGGNDQTGFTLNSNIIDDYIFCIPSNKWKLIEFIDIQTMSMIYQVNLTSPETNYIYSYENDGKNYYQSPEIPAE